MTILLLDLTNIGIDGRLAVPLMSVPNHNVLREGNIVTVEDTSGRSGNAYVRHVDDDCALLEVYREPSHA